MTVPAAPRTRGPRLAAAERRAQILDVTLALVAREGFQAVSMDAVARAAGITRPVVYGHFTDLTGLLNALMNREIGRALAQLATVLPPTDDPRPLDEVALEALRAYLAAVAATPDTWRLALMPIEGGPQVLQARIATDRATVREQLIAVIAAGLEREGVEADVDVELFAHAVQDYAEGAARLVLTDPERYPVARILGTAEAFAAFLLRR